MGIHYLWIDSLCIVQDSTEDWRKESVLMCSVYANSYCNIAATRGSSISEGCFMDRTIDVILPLRVEISCESRPFRKGVYEYRARSYGTKK